MVDGRFALTWHDNAISGSCCAVVGAAKADAFILLLPPGLDRVAVAVMARRHPGLTVEPTEGIGLAEAELARLRFEECAIGEELPVLGADAARAFIASQTEYLLAAANAVVAVTDQAVIAAGTFAAERGLMGYQVVRHRLAELAAQVRIIAALTEQIQCEPGSEEGDREQTVGETAILVAEQTHRIISGCLQLFGGRGYMSSHWIGQAYRQTSSLHLVLGGRRDRGWTYKKLQFGDPSWPDDIDQFTRGVAEFCAHRIVPSLPAWQKTGTLPRQLFADFGAAGYLGLAVPSPMGGGGRDIRYSLALVEALMDSGLPGIAVSLMLPANTICPLLVRYAAPELRKQLLPEILAGTMIPSLAVTEPGSSSNLVHSMRTTAEEDGDHWIIEGEKVFITNGPVADVVFVLARTRPQPGPLSMSLIAVPTSTAGFSVAERYDKLGLHLSPTGRLRFDRCRVPKRLTVGLLHHGFAYFSDAISQERLLIAAGSTALALSCLDETARRAGLSAHAELASSIIHMQACRALCRGVARALKNGEPTMTNCSLVKFAVCEAAIAAIESCARQLPNVEDRAWIEDMLCDTRVLTIFAGSSEAMKDLYAARLAARFDIMRRTGEPST
jgi:alkylation response protein AidB-like acyl-CoA dehydrogenase